MDEPKGHGGADPKRETAQGYTKAKYLTEETIENIISDVEEGKPSFLACQHNGTSSTQFGRRMRQDVELMRRFHKAAEEGKEAQRENLWGALWKAVEEGNYKAVRDMAIVLLPEWKIHLSHKLEVGNVDGEAFRMAALAQYGANLSKADVDKLVEILDRGGGNELPPAA